MTDVRDLFPDDDVAEMTIRLAEVEADELARLNAQELADDPHLAWRHEVSKECLGDAVSYEWRPDLGMSFFQHPDGERIAIPDELMFKFFEGEATPQAVAAFMRAVSMDSRFAFWLDHEEDG